MIDFAVNSIEIYEGQYYEFVFYSTYPILNVRNNLGFEAKMEGQYKVIIKGFPLVPSKEEPYYITFVADSRVTDAEDFNLKVYLKAKEIPYLKLGG